MKRAEIITIVCSVLCVVGIVGYLKFSSRLARAESDAKRANELLAELQQANIREPELSDIQPVAQEVKTESESVRKSVHLPLPEIQVVLKATESPSGDSAFIDGVAAAKAGRNEEALSLFKDVASRFPESEEVFEKLGTCYLDLERFAEAVANYRSGLVHHPKSRMLRNNLAVAYRLNEQHLEAIKLYEELVAEEPGDDGAWFFLGWSRLVLKQNEAAEDAFLRSSALKSDWPGTWFNLGVVCERQGKSETALLHYSRALNLDPRDEAVWDRFRTLMLDAGPHVPYLKAWLEAPDDADLGAYQRRVKEKVDQTAYSLFPILQDQDHPIWGSLRQSLETVREKNPDFAKSPTVFLFSSMVAAQRNGIAPKLTGQPGNGTLAIKNGTGADALVKIVTLDGPRLWRSVVVSTGQSANVSEVPDGHFLVVFALADKVDPETKKLSGPQSAAKFERSLAYTTSSKLDGDSIFTTSTSYSLTLHPVADGNAKTEAISLEDFESF